MLVANGIQSATASSYSSSQRQFLAFCQVLRLDPLPATERTILCYIAWLHKKGLGHSTINSHLSAIRNLHILNGQEFTDIRSAKVKLALRSIVLVSDPPRQKSAIDFKLLNDIWPLIIRSSDAELWSAVISLGFFAGLRGSEYAVNPAQGSGPTMKSVTFSPDMRALKYKVSKSKTKIHGFEIVLGCSAHRICALCCMKSYLKARGTYSVIKENSWLFETSSGKPVTKASIDTFLKDIMRDHGYQAKNYSTHSLRAGAASTAAQLGCTDYQVKAIGGWSSEAYKLYIRNNSTFTRNWPSKVAREQKD